MRDCYTARSVIRHAPQFEDKGSVSFGRRPAARSSAVSAWRVVIAWLFCLAGLGHQLAHAQQSDERQQPPHYLLLGSAGIPLRLTLNETFGQSRLAPAFGQVLVGYALPGGRYRHGFGAGVSWNLTHDGGYTDPIYGGDQFALMPAYLAYYALNTDVIGLGHVGVPILVRGGRAAGLEVGAALAYRLFAGAGLYGEVDLDAYAAGTFSVLASLQLGVMIDYEVLP
jgi:hypothetical protein